MWSFLKHFEGTQPGKKKRVELSEEPDIESDFEFEQSEDDNDNMILRLNKEIKLKIEREF